MNASRYLNNLRSLFALLGIMVCIHLINAGLGYWLLQFGIWPRKVVSLPFIPVAPFLHGNEYHLMSNLVGLAVFGSLCMLRSKKYFFQASFFIVVVSGLMVWGFARPALHIGASGWVFGLWSLCVAMAWVDRRPINILIAIFVIVFYGGMIYGVLPRDPQVSFESHLFGAVAGLLYALIQKRHIDGQ